MDYKGNFGAEKKTQIAHIENVRGGITKDHVDINRTVRKYHERIHVTKLSNLVKMDKFLERQTTKLIHKKQRT